MQYSDVPTSASRKKFTHIIVIIFPGLETNKVFMFGIVESNCVAKREICSAWTVVRIPAVLVCT
jgi:hypothetical protein